jgi:hypothetical protein
MNEENKICPLLSIVDNENGYLNCKRERCAWYCGGLKECSLKALALNTDHIETGLERAADALDDGIQANLADIADNILH